MKDRTRLIRTPSARIAPFCEICGKVDGPLPFGRGEVRLSYHLSGARCQDHPFQGGATQEELLCLELADKNDRQSQYTKSTAPMSASDKALVDAFLSALEV